MTDYRHNTDYRHKATRREQRKASPEGEAGGESCGLLPIGWLETRCMMMRTTKGNPGWWSENRKMISGWKRDKFCCTSRRPDPCLPWILHECHFMKTTHVNIPFIIYDKCALTTVQLFSFALHLSFIDKCAFTTFQVLRYVYHLLINVLLQLFRFCGSSISIDKCAFTTFRVLRYIYHILIDVLLQLSGFALHLSFIDKCAFTTFPVLRLG